MMSDNIECGESDIYDDYVLHWKNISVWSKCKMNQGVFRRASYENVKLLSNVNGYVRSGSMVAIMGPSGSGKTTLLTTISHRFRGKMKGSIYVNGDEISSREMLNISGFVPQMDLNVDSLTVYEHMYFMAVLKMNKGTSELRKLEKISSLLEEFGLEKNVSTYLQNLSGGERKRLSIAVQLLTNPYLLFCDEPTTGLDSWHAANVVNMLRKFSSQGKVVICSIHQPASGVFELFDDVLLLATGGRMAYFGAVSEAKEYFEKLKFKCPPSYNIAEFLLKIVSTRYLSEKGRVEVICRAYEASKRDTFFKNKGFSNISKKLKNINCYEIQRIGVPLQVYYLVWRSVKNLRFSYSNHLIKCLCFMFAFLITLSIFANVFHMREHRTQNIWGFMEIVTNQIVYFFTKSVLRTLFGERSLLLREQGSRLYSIEAYYLSKVICKTFDCLAYTLAISVVLKRTCDVFEIISFEELVLVFGVITIASASFGYMFSAIFDDDNLLIVTSGVLIDLSCFVSGFYFNLSSLPVYLNWLKYLSLQYYSNQAVVVLGWLNVDLDEMKRYKVTFDDPDAFRNLKMVAEFGFSVVDYRYSLCAMTMFALLFHFIAYLVIVRKSRSPAIY